MAGPSRGRVRVKDAAWRKIKDAAVDVGARVVKVGVIGSEAAHEREDGITTGRLAGVHEYGAAIKIGDTVVLIPERSFIRAPIAQNQRAYSDWIGRNLEKALTGRVSVDRFLGLLGARAVGDMQKAIAKGIEPPNAASTIARKKSSKPLVDTGLLRQSITWAVVDADDVEDAG